MFTLVDDCKANELRKKFINTFVDCTSPYYREYIANIKPDDIYYNHYTCGYLRDTFIQGKFNPATPKRVIEYISNVSHGVYTMWDIRPSKVIYTDFPDMKVAHPHYLDLFASDTVLYWNVEELICLLNKELANYDEYNINCTLPEDLYIFDETFTWCASFTHSYVTVCPHERLCYLSEKKVNTL